MCFSTDSKITSAVADYNAVNGIDPPGGRQGPPQQDGRPGAQQPVGAPTNPRNPNAAAIGMQHIRGTNTSRVTFNDGLYPGANAHVQVEPANLGISAPGDAAASRSSGLSIPT